jgi:hypothetical protein
MPKALTIEISDPQVRDVIVDALATYVEQLDGRASIQSSMGAEREAGCTYRQWARARAVLRMMKREGK